MPLSSRDLITNICLIKTAKDPILQIKYYNDLTTKIYFDKRFKNKLIKIPFTVSPIPNELNSETYNRFTQSVGNPDMLKEEVDGKIMSILTKFIRNECRLVYNNVEYKLIVDACSDLTI